MRIRHIAALRKLRSAGQPHVISNGSRINGVYVDKMSVENPASDNDCDAVSDHIISKLREDSFFSSILSI